MIDARELVIRYITGYVVDSPPESIILFIRSLEFLSRTVNEITQSCVYIT